MKEVHSWSIILMCCEPRIYDCWFMIYDHQFFWQGAIWDQNINNVLSNFKYWLFTIEGLKIHLWIYGWEGWKKKYSLLSGKEMKGRRFSHYPVLLNLLLSPDPEIWESKIKCNKYNESNDNLILTLTQVDLIT